MSNVQTRPQQAQVTCVNKRERQNPHERITHIGGSGATFWKITQEDAISRIERGEWNFYVLLPTGGGKVWVEIGVSRYGNKYLRTVGDNDERNNLLSLPECP